MRLTLNTALATLALTYNSLAAGPARAAEPSVQAPHWNGMTAAGEAAARAGGGAASSHLPVTFDPERWQGFGSLPAVVTRNLLDHFRVEMAPLTPNLQVNDPTGDATGETQSEVAVTADAAGHVVVAWNDSRGFTAPNTLSSYAYSCDFGATFTDGGNVPLQTPGDQAFGDCTLGNDGKGNFYLAQIYTKTGQSDVAVHKGSFSGGCPASFAWSTPVTAALENSATANADKPYIAVDPVTESGKDYVYVTYTRFTSTTAIVSVASSNGGVSWGAPVVIRTGSSSTGFPSGSKPVVDKNHTVHVAWEENGASGTLFCDLSYSSTTSSMGYSRSGDRGVSYSAPTLVAPVTAGSNLGSGVGNQRDRLNSFPDFAVDRSSAATSGNLYVIWAESATWAAPTATGISVPEGAAANDLPNGAVTINPGDNATGSISTSADRDYWNINLAAGQHLMLRLEPQGFVCGTSGTTRNFRIRLYANPLDPTVSPPETLLASSNQNRFASELHFDVKKAGTYYFRVQNLNSTGTTTGTYTVKSRLLTYSSPNGTTPARDARDIVMVRSTNGGTSWGAKTLVNFDSPADYEEEIPFLCTDEGGSVYAFWFDRRETETTPLTSFEGQWTDIYMDKSVNGGVSFGPAQRISDESSFFNNNTIAVPNLGDYNTAVSVGASVYAVWSDERKSLAATTGVNAFIDRFPIPDLISPVVTLNSPNGGENFAIGSTHNVTWTATDNVGVTSVDLAYSTDGGATYPNVIATGLGNTGSFSWGVPATPTTTARVRVTARDAASNSASAASAANFTISDQTAPLVHVLSPNGGEVWDTGSTHSIHWTASDNVGVQSVDVDYSSTGFAGPWLTVQHGVVGADSISWVLPVVGSDSAVVRVTAFDLATNQSFDWSDDLFHIHVPGQTGVPASTVFSFALAPPEPNPSLGRVDLRFSIPSMGGVRLEVMDVCGRRVWNWLGEGLSAGAHVVDWDGVMPSGAHAGVGLYWVRLTGTSGTRVVKLVRLN